MAFADPAANSNCQRLPSSAFPTPTVEVAAPACEPNTALGFSIGVGVTPQEAAKPIDDGRDLRVRDAGSDETGLRLWPDQFQDMDEFGDPLLLLRCIVTQLRNFQALRRKPVAEENAAA